jgi:uncharacterized protein (TIGR03083 family)
MTAGTDPTELSAERLLRVVEEEGGALRELAAAGELSETVPNCPDWTVAQLVAHLTGVYRWAALVLGERRQTPPSRDERAKLNGSANTGPELVDDLAEAHTRLVAALRAAPADLDCWTMWPARSSRHYWIRRQAHETLIHRVDVHNARQRQLLGDVAVAEDVAADGVDEMVTGFANRFRTRLRSPVPATICLHATDVDRRWWIRLGADDAEFGRGPVTDPDRTEVHARSGELLLALWNRLGWSGLRVSGPDAPLRTWRDNARV